MQRDNSTSFLSGFAIAIAAYCYSTLNGAVVGALIFSFGLITVIQYKWKLYTGTAGFVKTDGELIHLGSILFFNVLGCVVAGFLLSMIGSDNNHTFIDNALEIRKLKTYSNIVPILIRGLCCGFIMTTAVKFAREGLLNGVQYFLPLLFGVPIFLLSGFYHSIVDCFYIAYGSFAELPSVNSTYGLAQATLSWVLVVIGNFIGCNLTRIITFNKNG